MEELGILAVYNSPNLLMSCSIRRTASLSLVLLCLTTLSARGQDFRSAEVDIAHKIVAATGSGTATMEVINRSSLAPLDVEHIRDNLRSVLFANGVQVVPPGSSATSVRLSLSENLQGYVWVAKIQHGTQAPDIVLLNVNPSVVAAGVAARSQVSIQKTLLWLQHSQILDIAALDGNPTLMVILDPGLVTTYVLRNSAWQMEGSASILHTRPWPRDLRGRLVPAGKGNMSAYLPGLLCDIAVSDAVLATCHESNQPWPLRSSASKMVGFFAPARNFFTALSTADGQPMNAAPFYSGSPIRLMLRSDWIVAATDGKVHLVGGLRDQVLDGLVWGSDIAGVQSQCGTKWQVLTTGKSNGDSDSVQAFEVSEGNAVAVSSPVEFPGKITGLWSSSDAASAVAIVNNQHKGDYEAYRLSVVCGD